MLSQDRINTSTMDSVYTRIEHPVEVQRGEKILDRENEGLTRYSTASPSFIKAAHSSRVAVIPTASYNKWDCFSWRNRNNKVAVCTADVGQDAVRTSNLVRNGLGIMDAAISVTAQQALEVNNLINVTENNQVGRTFRSSHLPSIEGGYRRLTLREKLAKQRSGRDAGADSETPPSSKNDVAPMETQPAKRSTLHKSTSVDVRAAPGIGQHQPAVRSSSANAITEERTIFGFKIMKGALPSRSVTTTSKQNEQRSSVAVRSGNLRKQRRDESDRPRMGISKNAALFYSPTPADSVEVSSLCKLQEHAEDDRSTCKRKEESPNTLDSATDVSNTKDKIDEVVEVEKKQTASVDGSSLGASKQDTTGSGSDSMKTRVTQVVDIHRAEDNVGEIVEVKEKQKGRSRSIIIRTASLEEGKCRLQEFREKQRRGKLTRSLTNPDPHDGDEMMSPKSKNIAESLDEIRERIRKRRRKKDELKRSQSVSSGSDKTTHKESEKKENNAVLQAIGSEPMSAETAKRGEPVKRKETAKQEEILKSEEIANKEGTAEKEETVKIEETAKKEETEKKERTEEDKGVTLDEKERPTVTETVTQTDRNGPTKLDSSDKSESNIASISPSMEENKDGSVKPAESKKTTKRERRKLERYQRSKTMSAIMYSDIHSSATREMAHKDDYALHPERSGEHLALPPSVSEIKKRFLESDGASSKMSQPGLFYSQKVLPPRKVSSKKETAKDSENVSRKPETVSSPKKSESSSQKEEKLSESNSRNKATLSRRHTVDISIYIQNDVPRNEKSVLDSRHNGIAAPHSPDIEDEERPQRSSLLRRRHTVGTLSNYIANESRHQSPSLKASESVEDRRARFARGNSSKLVSDSSQESKPDEGSPPTEQRRRRIKSDGEVVAKMRTEIYVQVGHGTSSRPPLGRRHTIDIQPAAGGKQESENAKQEKRKFFERFLAKDDEVAKKEAMRVEHKETSGKEGSASRVPGKEELSKSEASKKDEERCAGKKKKQEQAKTTVSRLRKLFLMGRPASTEKKTKVKERRAKTIAEGISPEIMKEIEINTSNDKDQVVPNGSVVKPDLYYVAESIQGDDTEEFGFENSQRLDKGGEAGISIQLTSPSATDSKLERYLSDEPRETEESDSSRDPESIASTSEPALDKDSGASIKDQCLDDYLTTIKTLTSSPKVPKSFSKGSPRLKPKFKGKHMLSREVSSFDDDLSSGSNQNMKGGLTVETNLTHSWSTSDLDKLFYGAGETPKIPHVVSEMELSAMDFDEISDSTTRLQSLTEGRTKTRPRKNRSKSLNPLKSLQERTDLRTNTEEPVEEEKPTAGFEKVKKRSTPRKKRSLLEPWRRHTLDPVAIAALASREDFSRVSLRKTKGPGKDKDEFDGSLPVMLIQIKGRRQVQTRLVEPKLSSLNSGDCFILVTPKELFCWIGSNANTIEKAKAVEISSKIQKRGDLNCKTGDVLCIDEAKQGNSLAYKKFCKILEGDTSSPIEDAQLCPDDEFYERELISTNMMYKVQEGDPPRLVPVKELCGYMPRIVVLNTKEVFIFDFGSELYLWTGQQSLSGKRKVAFHLAQMLYKQKFSTDAVVTPIKPNRILKRPKSAGQVYHDAEGKECGRPAWTLFARLHEKAETLLFQEKFFDWPDPTKIIKMKGHVSSGETLERPPPIALKPYDVIEMQKPTIPLEPTVLECTNLGRGLGTPNVEVDGVMKEGDLVTTLGMTVWLVTQNKHFVLPKKSEGHFHSGDGYVIRWVYFVAKNRVVKNRRGRIRPLTGRQRCAYFFWQGNECSVSEKGAAAIMAVELDEERGPQIRVVEGKEPPHFLKLFEGAMVIHMGKRVRLPDGQDDFSDKSFVRMYCVCNEDTSEGCLVQVRKSSSSLRSRSSFVVVDCEAGHIYIWHGCKANGYHRKTAESAANIMKERQPEEVNLSEGKSVVLTEIEEGQEPESFWKTLGGKKSGYMSLIKDPLNYDFSPRLFSMSSSTGHFSATEILCPTRYPGRISPFPVIQEDLYFACQPAMFILDVGDELYVWEGWMPLEITNDKKGSAKRRWDEERKLSLETAMLYLKEANNRIKKGAYLVQAGLEPLSFISHFPYWERKQNIAEMKIKEGKKDSEKKPAKQVLESFTKKYYSFKELAGDSPPDGVDPGKLESYLSDQEFEEIFEMNRDLFNQIPSWRQDILKRALGLF